MVRLTVTLDAENAEYINEKTGDEGDFENESAVVNEAVRRMRTDGEDGVGAYEPLDERHQELRENGELRERMDGNGPGGGELASVLSKLKPW